MQAEDQGFTDVLTMTLPMSPDIEELRHQVFRDFVELIERAKATGRLRPDFVAKDMPLILMANAGVITASGDAAPPAWQRLVALLLRAPRDPSPQPSACAPHAWRDAPGDEPPPVPGHGPIWASSQDQADGEPPDAGASSNRSAAARSTASERDSMVALNLSTSSVKAGPLPTIRRMPIMVFAILFGLSMDYQVFLVSRMQEEWGHTGDNDRAES